VWGGENLRKRGFQLGNVWLRAWLNSLLFSTHLPRRHRFIHDLKPIAASRSDWGSIQRPELLGTSISASPHSLPDSAGARSGHDAPNLTGRSCGLPGRCMDGDNLDVWLR